MKFDSSFKILNSINIGWNLGNYLDAHNKLYKFKDSTPKSVEYITNLWHNPIFNLKCIDTLKNQGFNCIRIPVTFCNFLSADKNISISSELFKHLKTIIDYAIKKDFYVILDMHHDDQTWLDIAANKKEFKEICNQYFCIWQIVAKEFKDYNHHLIFEGMNEVIDRSNPEKHDWIGQNKSLYKNLNYLYKIFVKAVRCFSSNNLERTLIISTYGAQIHKHAFTHFKLPRDKNLIVDVHYYSKKSGIEHFEQQFKYVKKYLINKNIPLIIGECGIKKDYMFNFSILSTYLDFAKQNNIKCILWDNGSSRQVVNRETGSFTYTELKNYLNSK